MELFGDEINVWSPKHFSDEFLVVKDVLYLSHMLVGLVIFRMGDEID